MKTILGIDCATQPRKTGLALGHVEDGIVNIARCAVASNARPPAAIADEWLGGCDEVLLAFDSPLGWPVSLSAALADHSAGEPMPFESDVLFRRVTDCQIERRLRKRPQEIGASWLARTAVAALDLLDEIRRTSGYPIPLAWEPMEPQPWRVIEVYPAATRLAHGAPGGAGSTAGLESVLDCPAVGAEVARASHAADACVCALAGADFLRGLAVAPANLGVARVEGWIWVADAPIGPRRTRDDDLPMPDRAWAQGSRVDVGPRSIEVPHIPAGRLRGDASSGKPGCLACAQGLPVAGRRVCPVCGRVFAEGWLGIDAHWKARHGDVMPYAEFWASLCPSHRAAARGQSRF